MSASNKIPDSKSIFKAADRGLVDEIKSYATQTDLASIRDSEGCTCLHRAARNGQTQLVNVLLTELTGFNVNCTLRAKTALYEASCQGHVETVLELIKLGANVHLSKFNEWNPLHAAAAKGYSEICRVILDSISNVKDLAQFIEAANKEGSTALSLAAREGHAEVVNELLRRGANPNHQNHNNRVPLLSACSSGNVQVVQALIKVGKCKLDDEHVIDKSGANPMHEAAVAEETHVMEWLLENLREDSLRWARKTDQAGRLPVHLAALNNKSEHVRILLRNALDTLESKDQSGATPLFVASVKGYPVTASVLMSFQADPYSKDKSNKTCIDAARAWKRSAVLDVLERRKIALGSELVDTVGFGTYKLGEHTYSAVLHALTVEGSRSLDMAEFYGNESEVGRAIHDSKVSRKELFLTSKIWNNHTSSGKAREALLGILKRLGVDQLDVILVHWPCAGYEQAFGDLVKCRSEGLVRFVGVSNFLPHHVEKLKERFGEYPAVNQIEMSAFFYRKSQLEYFQQRGILVQVYRSLGVEGFVHKTFHASMDHPIVIRIAKEYGKTPAQILLRWCIQHGVCVIPKSVSKERIHENASVLGFNLRAGDMAELDTLTHPDLEEEWMKSVFKPSSEKDVVAPLG